MQPLSLSALTALIAPSGDNARPETLLVSDIKARIEQFTTQQILNIQPLQHTSVSETQSLAIPMKFVKGQIEGTQIANIALQEGSRNLFLVKDTPSASATTSISRLSPAINALTQASPQLMPPIEMRGQITQHDSNQLILSVGNKPVSIASPSTSGLLSPGEATFTLSTSKQSWLLTIERNGTQQRVPIDSDNAATLIRSQLPLQPLQLGPLVLKPDSSNTMVADASRSTLLQQTGLPRQVQETILTTPAQESQKLPASLVTEPIKGGQQVSVKFQPARDILARLTLPEQLHNQLQQLLGSDIPAPAKSEKSVPASPLTTLLRQLLPSPGANTPVQTRQLNELLELLKALPGDSSLGESLTKNLTQSTHTASGPSSIPAPLIRALLQAPPQFFTPQQFQQPMSTSGLVASLMSALQALQYAHTAQVSPDKVDAIISLLNQVQPTKPSSAPVGPQNLTDLFQFDQQTKLSAKISQFLSQHNSAKLAGSEPGQVQNPMFYALSIPFDNQQRDIELLINQSIDDSEEASSRRNKSWQLSMRLDVGTWGILLAKANIKDIAIGLQFICDNQDLKQHVDRYLPLLNERFTTLGVSVNFLHCEVGHIPDTLRQDNYHLIETQA